METNKAPARAASGAAGITAAVLLNVWCSPLLAASGIAIDSDAADTRVERATTIAAPALGAHTDSALADILDDESMAVPATADTTSEMVIDSAEETDGPNDDVAPAVESPAIITRLPGVSEAVLPSFRRQMHRTDI